MKLRRYYPTMLYQKLFYASISFTLDIYSGGINLNPGPFTDTFPFSNSSFSGSESRFHLSSNDENLDTEKWKNFKKKGFHFIHLSINSLFPKIDEIRLMTKITNASYCRYW